MFLIRTDAYLNNGRNSIHFVFWWCFFFWNSRQNHCKDYSKWMHIRFDEVMDARSRISSGNSVVSIDFRCEDVFSIFPDGGKSLFLYSSNRHLENQTIFSHNPLAKHTFDRVEIFVHHIFQTIHIDCQGAHYVYVYIRNKPIFDYRKYRWYTRLERMGNPDVVENQK